jgi:lipopolysaccharide/colanic/teichoic acid biosynthesis glycosyltransferase
MRTSEKPTKISASERVWILFQRGTALCVLIAAAPVFALLYLVVRLDSRGPFLYRQARPGRGGSLFNAYKIRTMTVGADRNEMLARAVTSDTPEVTRIGRYLRDLKVDELPQLWNVVRGDMAFVGPRPLAPPLQRHLEETIPGFRSRLDVPPGLTSLGQICIDGNEAVEHVVEDWSVRFEGEKHYLAHRSVTYDLAIVCLTVGYCLRKVIRTVLPAPGAREDQSILNPARRTA